MKLLKKLKFKFEMYKLKCKVKNRIMTLDMFLNHSRKLSYEGAAMLYILSEHENSNQ